MRYRCLGLGALLALAACSAPDYSPVRDWAATASLAVDYPKVATGTPMPPNRAETNAPVPRFVDGSILAMQEALATYLQAVATLASDGVLPYRESPFEQLAAIVTPSSASGGQAITSLGLLLRHASRGNAQAPELRDNIVEADPQVQALVMALMAAVSRQVAEEATARQDAAAFYADIAAGSRDAAARQALQQWARQRDAEFAAEAAARARYSEVLARVAEGHALLKGRAGRITRANAVQEIRMAEDQLRRASISLQRGSGG